MLVIDDRLPRVRGYGCAGNVGKSHREGRILMQSTGSEAQLSRPSRCLTVHSLVANVGL